MNRPYYEVYTKKARTRREREWFEFEYRQRWKAFMGDLFLDIGSGAGYFRSAAPRDVTVVALDRDGAALSPLAASGTVVQGDGLALPFGFGVFDGVHCAHVIEHTSQPDVLIAEIWRVLKRGGTLMIRTPDIHRAGFRFYVDHTHRSPFTMQSLRGLMSCCGFGDFSFEHGPFRTTRLETMLERVACIPIPKLYVIKKWLGNRYNDELVCVARKK